MPDQDVRLHELTEWLGHSLPALFAARGWGEVPQGELFPASSDASFRRYFRWQAGSRSLILMDAPPPQEDCRPFVQIADLLARAGVAAADFAEQVVGQESLDALYAIESEGRLELQKVLHALARMDRGEYAVCARCGGPIGTGRLAALPYADTCIGCAD